MSPEDFDGLVDNEIQQAVWWQDSAIKGDRERNYQYYLGLPMGNEVPGRSQVVSWDVFETVESVLPDLLEIFLASDNIAEFAPTGPEDEAWAAQATDYINYLVTKKNPGFLIFNTWFKDALLSKLGIVRAYWNSEAKVTRENYVGLDETGLTMLLDGENVEVIDQSSYPDPQDMEQREQAAAAVNAMAPEQAQQVLMMLQQPPKMLYDVSVKVTKPRGQLCIDNVRPETFIVSKRATKLPDAMLQGEIRPFTRSELVSMGIKKADAYSVLDYDFATLEIGESLKEQAEHSTNTWQFDDSDVSIDKSTEEVLLFCGFVQADFDGDGIAEWRYVLRGGNMTLRNVEADGPDYAVLTPIPIPHAVFGLSLADTVASIQQTNTALTRQYLDSLYLANNPRTYVNTEQQVNLDDLLNNRIGGLVRGKGPAQTAVAPLVANNVARESLEGIEFMDTRREQRTGVTRYNQGLDADSLNKTATGVTKIMGKGDKRTLMIARIFAETGVKDLFKLCLKVVCQYQDKEAVVKLRNKWVSFNPREWSDEMDATIEVGLGTGDTSELTAMWDGIIAMQTQALQAEAPIADWNTLYRAIMQRMKAMKVKGADLYWIDPNANQKPPEPPQPTPEQVLAQAEVEKAKIKAQSDREKMVNDTRLKEIEYQIELVKLRQAEVKLGIQNRDSLVNAAVQADEQDRADRQESAQNVKDIAGLMQQSDGQMGDFNG
ncbi:conserved hypothetical protein [Cupriavidus taiwanensis]|uniref:portal protein n=1 Tax=Cupriavidus taiwanensis TaxID=164546 RepID=UPI000E14651F|nr:hypothetical protein [Cupriavidus taiwanensis]SOY79938.1 conserved hypothetical protein [Cupriavidus taiwanensis]SOY81907.1 conserved hypothetical protein [Cupriavidus taiwanensis]